MRLLTELATIAVLAFSEEDMPAGILAREGRLGAHSLRWLVLQALPSRR